MARPKRQAPEAQARLEAFGKDYLRRVSELDEQQEALRAERDEAIRAAHQGDLPMQDIASILGLSFQRVQQIVRS